MLSVGPAPTNRATCQLCGRPIAMGAQRVLARLTVGCGFRQESYHLECARKLLGQDDRAAAPARPQRASRQVNMEYEAAPGCGFTFVTPCRIRGRRWF